MFGWCILYTCLASGSCSKGPFCDPFSLFHGNVFERWWFPACFFLCNVVALRQGSFFKSRRGCL